MWNHCNDQNNVRIHHFHKFPPSPFNSRFLCSQETIDLLSVTTDYFVLSRILYTWICFNFYIWWRLRFKVNFFHTASQLFKHYWIKRLSFATKLPLSKINCTCWIYFWTFCSDFLVHDGVLGAVCIDANTTVLITSKYGSLVILKSGSRNLQILIFLKILTIPDPLHFSLYFRITSSIPSKHLVTFW